MQLPSLSIVASLLLVPVACGQAPEAPDDTPAGKPKLVVEKQTVDLGSVKEDAKVDAVFLLENTGDANLVIERVRTSCGCTTVKLSEEEKTIPAGGKQAVTARFNTKGRSGKQKKYVTITSNDPEQPTLKLTLTAEVLTLAQVTPTALKIGEVRRGELVSKTVVVLPGVEGAKAEIVSLEVPGDVLSCTAEPFEQKGRQGKRLWFRVDPDAKLGRLTTAATLKVRVGTETQEKRISIRGEIVGDLAVHPTSVHLDKASARGIQLRPVMVSSVSGDPFKVFGASAGACLETTVKPIKSNTEYAILLRLAEEAPDGPCGAFLEVRTDSVMQPLVRVAVYVNVAPRLSVDPPIVLLKSGGSPDEGARRVLLGTPTGSDFSIVGVDCDRDFIDVATVETQGERPGKRVLRVALNDLVKPGTHSATVVLETDVAGAERVEIPVTVMVPGSSQSASSGR